MSEGTAAPLRTERRGPILILTLDRPEARNTITPGLLVALGRAVLDAEADPQLRAVVLTASGERTFCAGMDLRATGDDFAAAMRDEEAAAGFAKLLHGELSLPVVGAAGGSAVAGGLELLLGCDLIVASSEARFGLPEVKRGLIPGGNGTLLAARIPLANALELVLTGESISAARALEIGLVNRVVPPAEVLTTALALAERIAANGPLAVAAARELVRLGATDLEAARRQTAERAPGLFASADAQEGARAYLEKREPVWKKR